MGIKYSPEAFSEFDALDADSQRGVIESFSAEDQAGFAAAYEENKKAPSPGFLDSAAGLLRDGAVGSYKRVVGIEPSAGEQAALMAGMGGMGGAILNKLPPGVSPGRLIAGDVMSAVNPTLGLMTEQQLGVADEQGVPTPEVAKAATDLEAGAKSVLDSPNPFSAMTRAAGVKPDQLAAVTRFVPQMAANVVGDVGAGALIATKAAGMLGSKAGYLGRAGAAVSGAVVENMGMEAFGAFTASGGDWKKTAEHLVDVATNPLAAALMVLPGVIGARAAKQRLSAPIEEPDLRTPQQIKKEGGEVYRGEGSPESFEVTRVYDDKMKAFVDGGPKAWLQPEPKTAMSQRKIGERDAQIDEVLRVAEREAEALKARRARPAEAVPASQDVDPVTLTAPREVDPAEVAQVERFADAENAVRTTQVSQSPMDMPVPGPIAQLVEAAAAAEFRAVNERGGGYAEAAFAAEAARERVISEWLGIPDPRRAGGAEPNLNMDAFDDPSAPRGPPTRNGRVPTAEGFVEPGPGQRALGDDTERVNVGRTNQRFEDTEVRQVRGTEDTVVDPTVVRNRFEPVLDPTVIQKIKKGRGKGEFHRVQGEGRSPLDWRSRQPLEGEVIPPGAASRPGQVIDGDFRNVDQGLLPEGQVRGRPPGPEFGFPIRVGDGSMKQLEDGLGRQQGPKNIGKRPTAEGPPIIAGGDFPTRAPQGSLKPEFRRPVAQDLAQVRSEARRRTGEAVEPNTVAGPSWAGKMDAAISGRQAKMAQDRRLKLGGVDAIPGSRVPLKSPPSAPSVGDKTNPGSPPFSHVVVPEALRNAVGSKGTMFYFDEAGNVKKATLYEDSGEGLSANVKSPGIERLLEMEKANEGGGGRSGGPPVDNLNRPPEFGPGHPIVSSAAALKRVVERDSVGFMAKLREIQRAWSIPANYAGREVAPYLLEAKASQSMQKAAFEKNVDPLNKAYKALSPEEQATWQSVMKRVQNKERVSINEVPAAIRDLTKNLMEGINKRVHFLATNGYFDPKHIEALQKQLDDGSVHMSWLTRDYEIFYRGKNWRAEVPAYQAAIDGFMKYKDMDVEEAHRSIRAIMDAFYNKRSAVSENRLIGTPDSAKMRSDLEGAVASVLKERTLPEFLRPLLGEITDPRFTLAMSSAELERMTQQYAWTKSFIDTLPEGGQWISAAKYDALPLEAKAKFHPQKVEIEGLSATRNKQTFGELAGKYVHRDVWESLMAASPTKMNNMVFDSLGKFQSWFRAAKTLGAPMSFIRNNLSNTMASAAGGLPVWDPRWASQQVNALRARSQFNKAASLDDARLTPDGKWMAMAMEDGAIPPGHGSEIISGDASRVLENMINEGSYLNMTDKVVNAFNNKKMQLAHAYELMDSIPRLAVYRFQTERGLKSGLNDRQARMRASQIVNRYFASSSNLGPVLQQVSKVPFFNAFLGWGADNVRVHKNIASDAGRALLGEGSQSLNPSSGEGMSPLVNVMLHKALFLSALGAGARAMFGVTDAEQEAGEASLSNSYKQSHPSRTIITLPFSNGQLYAISLDTFDPTATLLRGPPESPVTNIVGNVAKVLTEGGLLESVADKILPIGAPAQMEREDYPAEFWDSALQAGWDWAAPGAFTQFQAAARKMQVNSLNFRPGEPMLSVEPLRKGEEQLSGFEAFNKYVNPLTAPLLPEKIGGRMQTNTRKSNAGEVNRIAQQPRKIGANPNLSPAQRQKYQAGSREEVRKRKQ